MKVQCVRIDRNLVAEYEILRAQMLSAGISSPLSQTDYRIISDGLLQWAVRKQMAQQKTPTRLCQESDEATSSASSGDHLDVGVINLIASMTIQSIIRNQRVI